MIETILLLVENTKGGRKMSGQKYILVRCINNDVQYATITNTGGTKIVKDIKKATVFASKAKAEERKRHSQND